MEAVASVGVERQPGLSCPFKMSWALIKCNGAFCRGNVIEVLVVDGYDGTFA